MHGGKTINLSVETILFGITEQVNNHTALNLSILVAKYYIHLKKQKNKNMHLAGFRRLLQNKVEPLHIISVKQNKIVTFNKTWPFYENI